jgi:hypothetical protein
VTALYLILIKRSSTVAELSPFDLLYNNTLLAVPMLFLFLITSDELEEVSRLSVWSDIAFLATLLLSLFSAAFCELGMCKWTKKKIYNLCLTRFAPQIATLQLILR